MTQGMQTCHRVKSNKRKVETDEWITNMYRLIVLIFPVRESRKFLFHFSSQTTSIMQTVYFA